MMKETNLGSWVEITVPQSLMPDIQPELDAAVDFVGGVTVSEARGYYKSRDGKLILEDVFVLRFDFNGMNFLQYCASFSNIVKALHKLGEESVLRRSLRQFGLSRYSYESVLIFK